MEKSIAVNEEQKTRATETQIFQLKSVVHKNNTLLLIEYIACILMALLFFLPLINVDLGLTEEKLSLFDILFASPEAETFKGQFAYSVGKEAFGVSSEKFNPFLSIVNPSEHWNSQNIAGSIISLVFWFFVLFGCTEFCIYFIIRPLFMILPTCLRYNVERHLRYATPETFDTLFVIKDDTVFNCPIFIYDYEHNLNKDNRKQLKKLRKTKKDNYSSVGNCLGYTFLNSLAIFFPFAIIFKISALEGVGVSFLLYGLAFAFAICIIVCKIMQVIHSTKYQLTLYQCKALKDYTRI